MCAKKFSTLRSLRQDRGCRVTWDADEPLVVGCEVNSSAQGGGDSEILEYYGNNGLSQFYRRMLYRQKLSGLVMAPYTRPLARRGEMSSYHS
jgi:hypothetical protein